MNYPSGIIKTHNHFNSYKNRGMGLENDLNTTNQYYLDNDIAVVYKKPTPITINKVDYHSRTDAVIKEAYFKTPSTTDYNGIYNGKYIDFEAKETKSKTSFPLNNIHPHQIEHLKRIYNHKGIGFLIIKFVNINQTYLLFIKDFLSFIDNQKRKSIPIGFIKEKGHLIKEGINPRIDYIKIIKEELGDLNEKENI